MSKPLLFTVLVAGAAIQTATSAWGGDYLVFPITTELQRTLVEPSVNDAQHAKAYLLINAIGVVANNGTIDSKMLELDAMRTSLRHFAEPKEGIVVINVVHQLNRSDLLTYAMQGFGQDAGFRKAKVSNTYMGQAFEWEKHIAAINEKTGGETNSDESPTGTQSVRVYPVRTILSRHLTSNADCLVDILQPIEKETDSIETKIREAVLAQVPKAKVKNKGRILFRVSSNFAARNVIDQFVEHGSKDLAQMVGYEYAIVQIH